MTDVGTIQHICPLKISHKLAGDDVEVRPVHAGHLRADESRRDCPPM